MAVSDLNHKLLRCAHAHLVLVASVSVLERARVGGDLFSKTHPPLSAFCAGDALEPPLGNSS
jgi:hypothetical protein